MNPQDFEKLASLLYQRSGLVLGQDKVYLAESRLTPVARNWALADAAALVRELARGQGKGRDARLIDEVVEAMTTNESFFFRDQKPFDQFRDMMLPRLMEARAGTRSLRIWSAACSSGQEPYSLAMVLNEMGATLRDWRIEILATDLSNDILNRAREASYTQFEVQRGLPIQMLAKYFHKDGDRWRLNRDVRDMVKFRPHNLLEDARPLGRFDIIFCRNVLIYFDQATKRRVLDYLSQVIADDGFLTLGGAETVLGLSDSFRMMPDYRGVYCPTSKDKACAAGAR